MRRLKKPITNEIAVILRVWFTSSGSSPDVPYFERKRYEERAIKVPGHMMNNEHQTSIVTDQGETFEP